VKRDLDLLLVAGVAFLAYLGNLGNGFVYDDRFIIEQNPLVQNLDWKGLAGSSYWGEIVGAGLYRPVTLLSFGLNRLLGASAFSFHLVNDSLHALASVLVLLAARALGASRFVCVSAALLFALHPVQTEAVSSLVGRAEILALGFALGAFVVLARGGRSVWVGIFFFLALCSKESAAFALPLFVLYWLLFERRSIAPITGAVVAYAALRVAALGSFGIEGREIGFLDNPLAGAPFITRAASAFTLLAEYGKLLVWPATLSADYSYNQISLVTDIRMFVGMAIVVTLCLIAWRERGLVAFAALGFLVPLSGFLHIVFPLGTLFAERLTYLPMFGATLLAALALDTLPKRSWLLGAALALSFARVVTRNPDWHDNETLFRRTVQTSPRSARSHFLLGAELLEHRRYREAAASFETGLAIAPRHVGARMSLGEARLELGEPAEALAAFEQALGQAPSEDIQARAFEAAIAAGRMSARETDWDSAETYFERARELDPESPDGANSLGLVAERQGKLDEARGWYEMALRSDPDYVPVLVNLASVHMNTGDLEAAEELFRRAVFLAPDSYEAHNGLGIALARQGKNDDAEAAFRRAFEIDPSLEAAPDNLRALGKTP